MSFKLTSEEIYRQLQGCQNSKLTKREGAREERVNWFEFAQKMVHEHLKVQFFSEDSLNIFKLPVHVSSSEVFNILWSSSYLVFNNGSKLSINQHMRSKAVELAELISAKLT
jgi:hypothetical protein